MLSALLMLPAFNNGQINFIVTAAVVGGVAAAARGRWWVAAFAFAAAAWFKLYPLAAGMLGAVASPLKLSWRLLIAVAVAFAVPFALQNPRYVWDRHVEMVSELGADDRSGSDDFTRAPRDWTILPRAWFGVRVPRAVSLPVAAVAGLGMAAGVAWRAHRRRDPAGAWPLVLAFGLIWTTLFGPATEANTYSLLAPVAGWVAAGVGGAKWWVKALAWIGIGLLTAAILRGAFPTGWGFLMPCGPPVGAMLLLIAAPFVRVGVCLPPPLSKGGPGGVI